jgi:hypothetical protein
MRKFFLFILLIATFAHTDLWAQKITVNAHIDSTVLWIGDQANLTFQVSQKLNQRVNMPVFSDSIVRGLELVGPVKTDTVKSKDGPILVTQHYVVTSFKDSLLYIPPFPFICNGDTVWSKSLSLKVVQPFKIDTASHSIADIKSVFNPKFDWPGLAKIILLILLIQGLLVIALILYRKFKKNNSVFENNIIESLLPPHIVALNRLDRIKQDKPWQQGRTKEYHTELTDIIREYIECIFNIKSMELTSDEILDQLNQLRKNEKTAYLGLKQMLQLADLVKFAKWNPTPDEHELSLRNAYLFIDLTKVEDVKPTEAVNIEEPKANNEE